MRSKEKHRIYNLEYYHEKRKKLVQALGGRCCLCGSVDNLEFDHIDSRSKRFGISAYVQRGDKTLLPELTKCQLLCHDCHVKKSKQAKDTNVKISSKVAESICKDYANLALSQKEIAIKYGISVSAVSSVVRGARWSRETASVRESISSSGYTDKSRGSRIQEVPVDKIDSSTGEVLYTYSSMAEAKKEGYNPSAISRCCNGKATTHKGYFWRKHAS